MLSARRGVPPIAYTSLRAFTAAIAPKSYGSSTMGGKKSIVWTTARSSARRVDGGVVARVEPHEQVVVPHVGEVAQDLAEVLGAELAGSARAGGQTGESDFFLLHGGIIAANRRGAHPPSPVFQEERAARPSVV